MADDPQFTIRDRRRQREEPSPPSAFPSGRIDRSAAFTQSSQPPPPNKAEAGLPGESIPLHPPSSFSELMMGLASSAVVALGLGPTDDPSAAAHPLNLDAARHAIDLLAILEEKTTGNLTPDEQQLLQHLLSTLRFTFVEKSRSPAPPAGGVG